MAAASPHRNWTLIEHPLRHRRDFPGRKVDHAGMKYGLTTVQGEILERAHNSPDRPAFLAPGNFPLTYVSLAEQIHETASAIRDLGIARSGRVAVSLPFDCTFPVALVSVLCSCACIPLNPELSPDEIESALRSTRATALVTVPRLASSAAEAAGKAHVNLIELEPLPELGAGRFRLRADSRRPQADDEAPLPCDLAVLLMTSGSTAAPKLVPLTQEQICYRAHLFRPRVGLTAEDRWLAMMPPFRSTTLINQILGCVFAGASIVFPGPLSLSDFGRCVDEFAPTWIAAPPPFVERLLRSDYSWDITAHAPIRAFYGAGGQPSANAVAAVERKFGATMVNAYGATESGGICANPMPPGLRKIDSVGVSSGPDIAILDESGRVLPDPGIRGEIAVRGPGVFEGYETPDGLDRSTFVDGWHRTGDEGYLDADGYLFLTGRIMEVIDRGGQKISPAEVEVVLRQHPRVRDAAVFAMRHDIHGQEVAALIAGREATIDVHDVRTFAGAKLAWFKVPRVILAVPDIPLTPTGKVPRTRLASMFEKELAAAALSGRAPYEPPRTLIESAIAMTWAGMLKVERVGVNDRFSDLGGDSLTAVTMIAEINRKLGCEIPVTELWRSPTVANLASLVEGKSTSRPSLLFPANPAGSLPPLYCVLPGYFPEVEDLSRYLGSDQPVYALIPDPRPDGAQHGKSPEEIVGECVNVIRGVQPHGPYYLLGRSIGGIVAVEIALQLRAVGEPVAFVGMIDTPYPANPSHASLPKPFLLIEKLAVELIALPRERWRSHLLNLPFRALRRRARLLKGPSDKILAAVAMNTGLKGIFTRPPARYDGRITLFAAEESEHRGFLDRRLYWGKAAAEGLELYLLPGTHNLMSQEPLLGGFAETLKGCLERSQHKSASASLCIPKTDQL